MLAPDPQCCFKPMDIVEFRPDEPYSLFECQDDPISHKDVVQ